MSELNIKACMDTGCTVLLMDHKIHKKYFITTEIRKADVPIQIHRISNESHNESEYVKVDIYIQGNMDTKVASALMIWEFHLVDNLKLNILIRIDILKPEKVMIDLKAWIFKIGSCDHIVILIQISSKRCKIKWVIKSKLNSIVLPQSAALVLIYYTGSLLVHDWDYVFEPNVSTVDRCVMVVTDSNIQHILVFNDTDVSVKLPKNDHSDFSEIMMKRECSERI